MIVLRKYGIEQLRANVDPDTIEGRDSCPEVGRMETARFIQLASGKLLTPFASLEGYMRRGTNTVFGVEWVNKDGDVIFPDVL